MTNLSHTSLGPQARQSKSLSLLGTLMLSQCPRFNSAPSEVRSYFSPEGELEAEAFREVGTSLFKRVTQTARDSLGSCSSVAGGKAGPEGREQSTQVLLGLVSCPFTQQVFCGSIPAASSRYRLESWRSCPPTYIP